MFDKIGHSLPLLEFVTDLASDILRLGCLLISN